MSSDEQWMQMAVELALRGQGAVEPNPMVGCVIVRDDNVIGVGWHEDVMAYAERAKDQVITTPSYRQVTDEVQTRAAGRWQRYRQQMQPVVPYLARWVEAYGYSTDDTDS